MTITSYLKNVKLFFIKKVKDMTGLDITNYVKVTLQYIGKEPRIYISIYLPNDTIKNKIIEISKSKKLDKYINKFINNNDLYLYNAYCILGFVNLEISCTLDTKRMYISSDYIIPITYNDYKIYSIKEYTDIILKELYNYIPDIDNIIVNPSANFLHITFKNKIDSINNYNYTKYNIVTSFEYDYSIKLYFDYNIRFDITNKIVLLYKNNSDTIQYFYDTNKWSTYVGEDND